MFFFKTSTAYEVVIRDWSSAVCSSDLWVAWSECKPSTEQLICIAQYKTASTGWVIDSERLNVDEARPANNPSIAFSAADGYLYVAFEEQADGYSQIFVKRKKIRD